MEPILIPPGNTQLWKCPAGSAPTVAKGQILKVSDKAAMYVVDVSADGIILGPLLAGDFEVAGLCKDQPAVRFQIEAPDPQKVDKNVQPLGPVGMAYPLWMWLALFVIVAAIGAVVWLVIRLLNAKEKGTLNLSAARLRKTPTEKMQNFLSKVDHQKLVDQPDVESSQLLYSETLKLLRALLQEAYGFKAPGATTTEFIGELKAQALRKPGLMSAPQTAQLESAFMQAKQVTYAREVPDLELRRSYLKSVRDFADHLSSKIAAANAAATANETKNRFKRKKKT